MWWEIFQVLLWVGALIFLGLLCEDPLASGWENDMTKDPEWEKTYKPWSREETEEETE